MNLFEVGFLRYVFWGQVFVFWRDIMIFALTETFWRLRPSGLGNFQLFSRRKVGPTNNPNEARNGKFMELNAANLAAQNEICNK